MKNIVNYKAMAFYNLIIICFITFCCSSSGVKHNLKVASLDTIKNEIKTPDTINQLEKIYVDLASIKSFKITAYQSTEHKTFSNKNEKDSLMITPGFSSVLTAHYQIKGKKEDEGDYIFSKFNLYNKKDKIFEKDSVLAITPFELNNSKTLVSFSILYDQNADTFQTNSDLYLADLKSKKISCLKKNLSNTVNAPFSNNQNFIYFLDNLVYYKYDIVKKTSEKVFEFSNDGVILNIKVISSNLFCVIYLKDISQSTTYKAYLKLKNK